MDLGDAAAAAFYADPVNQAPAGPGRRRNAPRKSAMVAVRFDQATIDRCRDIAHASGMTASSWIRQAVQREMDRTAREHRPHGLIAGSERLGELRALPSAPRTQTINGGGGGSASCAHLSIGNVTAASCGICGPLTVRVA